MRLLESSRCSQIQTVFVFASVCCCSPCGRERLNSDSRVASDHQNRHHHHRHTFQPDRCALKLVLQTVFDLKYTLGKGANTKRQIHFRRHFVIGHIASPRQILNFFPNYPPPDHNLGQILNSDPASSYFPLKFADLLKLKYFLHP